MGAGKEATSVWVVIASVGVVALAGLVLRVERVEPAREAPIVRRQERVRRAELLRQRLRQLDERLRSSPISERDGPSELRAGEELPPPPTAAR